MKKINFAILLLLGLLAVLPPAAVAGEADLPFAQVPFNTVMPANPNVLFFLDNTGYMSRKVNADPEGRKRWTIVTDVIAGKHIPITYTNNSGGFSNAPVYQPHYDFNTVGQYWVFDRVVGQTVDRNWFESAVIPRVIRLAMDPSGFYYPSAAGTYFKFVHQEDATRVTAMIASDTTSSVVTNLAAFFRSAEPQDAAIVKANRWTEYYINRVTATGSIHYTSTDEVTGKTVWSVDDSATSSTYATYADAVKRFYYYEESGAEAGGTIDNRVIVPLKYVAANSATTWTSPSDGLLKTGLCYVKVKNKTVTAFDCYKPTTVADPAATRFLLYNNETAEQLVLNKTTLSAWRAARLAAGDAVAGNASRYCQAASNEVWGDAPYLSWYFDTSNRPVYDSPSTAAAPVYGATIGGVACAATSPGSFLVGLAPPSDAGITSDLNTALFRVLGVNASVGTTVDEFVLPSVAGTNPQIDTYLKTNIGKNHSYWCDFYAKYSPGYSCPSTPTWGALTFATPWYNGYYDNLYWDGSYRGSPGIMETFQNINYGFATYETQNVSSTNCTGLDFAADSDGNCNVADLKYNISSWGEFKAYQPTYSVALINKNLRDFLIGASDSGSANSPIASSLHSLWRYFYNVDTQYPSTNPHTTDVYSTNDPLVLGGVDVNSMFFDLGFPDPWGSGHTEHIIQCDPFYKNGCRRNYLIYLTGGRDRNGERLYTTDPAAGSWVNDYFPSSGITLKIGDTVFASNVNLSSLSSADQREMAAQGKWIFGLKNPAFITDYGFESDFGAKNDSEFCRESNKTDMIPYGVKSFFIGFGLGDMPTGDGIALGYMAWASIQNPDDEDEIDYFLVANNEETLRQQLTTVMNSIMAGQFARAAPAISNMDAAVITTTFTVGAGYPLWQGHLYKWDLEKIKAGTVTAPEWDFADLIAEQAESDSRDIFTYLNGSRYNLWGADPSASSAMAHAMDPGELYWGNSTDLIGDEAPESIKVLVGYPDAEFITGKPIRSYFGPVYHSKPIIIGAPNTLSYMVFPGYKAFIDSHLDRPPQIFVGTGYGILEAIDLDTGRENWGFVPPGMIQYIPMLRRSQQPYGVDGAPVNRDALFYDEGDGAVEGWHTLIMTGMAGGGTSYSTLDITNVDDTSDNVSMLWNFTDPNIALTYSVPVIGAVNYQRTDGVVQVRWQAFFGGGFQEKQDLLVQDRGNYFYVVDMQSGALMQRFEIPDTDQITDLSPLAADTTEPNFNQIPTTPLLIDKDLDRDHDYAFFSDMKGRVWKLNFTSTYVEDDPSPWKLCAFYDTNDTNVDSDLTSSEASQPRLPVYYTPDATRTPDNKLLVFFGQGNAEWKKDNDTSVYRIYALIDPETTGCDYSVPLPEVINGKTVAWPIALEPGEKMLTPIHIISGQAIFKTFLPAIKIACSAGTTRLWSVDYLTGTCEEDVCYKETIDGKAIGTTDIDFDIGIGGGGGLPGPNPDDPDPPQTFNIPIMPADPLSWGEGVTF